MLVECFFNDGLLLKNSYFIDNNINLDYICNKSYQIGRILTHKYNTASKTSINKLYAIANLLNTAANICEKFHSYFHYEESFFHTEYANNLISKQDIKKIQLACLYYEGAVKQHPLNLYAHKSLIYYYKFLNINNKLEDSIHRAQKLGINNLDICTSSNFDHDKHKSYTQEDMYMRPFSNFADYIEFACSAKVSVFRLPSFWCEYEKYKISKELKQLENIITQIKLLHQQYHDNAAILYYNLYKVYMMLDKESIAKNYLTKSKNLSPQLQIKEKDYS